MKDGLRIAKHFHHMQNMQSEETNMMSNRMIDLKFQNSAHHHTNEISPILQKSSLMKHTKNQQITYQKITMFHLTQNPKNKQTTIQKIT